jgi:Amt family ammonium transporter
LPSAPGGGTFLLPAVREGHLMPRSRLPPSLLLLTLWLALPPLAGAQEAAPAATPQIDSGDTAWLLTSSALVLAMTVPGLALFYGGLVRSKNVLNTMMQCFIVLCLVSVQWVLWGYSLAFGPDRAHLIGGLEWVGLAGVGAEPNPDYAATVPHQAFMVFQLMFAVITPALMTGAFVERMRFGAFLLFIVLWSTFIYDPLAHWVWGVGGWLRELGALDFAGGTVVHVSSGVAALACALVLGPRFGHGHQPMVPHNLPLTIVGASMPWFGWFGFNAGSALTAGGIAAGAFVTTNTATAAAALAWMACEWVYQRRPTVLGAASGAVSGLVAITPAAGFVGPLASLAIGVGAGVFCYVAVVMKARLGFDDALDAFAVHGIGGTWGALATGLFASTAVNPGGADGLFFGNPAQLGVQATAVLATWAFAFGGTYLLLKLVDVLAGLRVAEEEEITGLDLTQHNEGAYALGAPMGGAAVGAPPPRRAEPRAPEALPRGEALPGPASARRPRFPFASSRRPPAPAPAPSPGPAQVLALQDAPFDLVVEADPRALRAVWDRLCRDYPADSPREFNLIYPYVFTFSGSRVRFHKGDPGAFRDQLQHALALYGLDPVRVEIAQ